MTEARKRKFEAVLVLAVLPVLMGLDGPYTLTPTAKVAGGSISVGRTRSTEGHPRKWQKVDGCTISRKYFPKWGWGWDHSPYPEPSVYTWMYLGMDSKIGASCPSINSGIWFPWADQDDGRGDGVSEEVIGDAPTPTFRTESKWYSQRVHYIWIPREWGDPTLPNPGVTIPLYGVTSGRDYGEARVIATDVRLASSRMS